MRKELKLFILGFAVLCMTILLMNTQVFAVEVLNEENPVLDLTGKTVDGITVEGGNVTIEGNGTVAGPVIIRGGNVTIKGNSTFTGSANQNVIYVGGGNVTIEGGTFTSNSGYTEKTTYSALYVDSATSEATVTVNGGTFTGKVKDYAARVCGEHGTATLTINNGTFHAQHVTGLADCGGLFYINGGTWSCESEYNGQSDILNAKTIYSGEVGKFVVAGGTFENFDPTNIYSEGPYPAKEAEYVYSLAEGYAYDTETGTVACAHGTLTPVEEVKATYTSEGTKAHIACATCEKLFADAEATEEVTADSLVIPKLVASDENNDEEKVEEAKDPVVKTGIESTTLTAFATIAVISLASLIVIKKRK